MRSFYELKVPLDIDAKRLDIFLTENLSDLPSRSFVKKIIDAGCVCVNEKTAKANYKVASGDQIKIQIQKDLLIPENISPEAVLLDIFYEDDYLLVVNKPSGMLVHPASGKYEGTLLNALKHHCPNLSDINSFMRSGIVHRLDQDTSGLMLVAKDNKAHIILARQFERHNIQKTYLALVEGNVPFDQGRIDVPLGRDPIHRDKKAVSFDEKAKEALTVYQVIKRKDKFTFIALYPQTGRTHQLRVHLKYLGHPILGDSKYGRKDNFPRLALHAQSIGFTHPMTKCYLEVSTKIPDEFLKIVN